MMISRQVCLAAALILMAVMAPGAVVAAAGPTSSSSWPMTWGTPIWAVLARS